MLHEQENKHIPPKEYYMSQMQKAHRQLIANAKAIELYHSLQLKGQIGIVLNVNPGAAWNAHNPADIKAANFQDILINGLFLDPLYKGKYPKWQWTLWQNTTLVFSQVPAIWPSLPVTNLIF
jgi:beta-glucosidase/6-phospho-beta-glucosidase/beta-galactosidase